MAADPVKLHGTPAERIRSYCETVAVCLEAMNRPGATAAERDYALLGVLDNLDALAEEMLTDVFGSNRRSGGAGVAENSQRVEQRDHVVD